MVRNMIGIKGGAHFVVFGKGGCEGADEVGGWLPGADFGEVV